MTWSLRTLTSKGPRSLNWSTPMLRSTTCVRTVSLSSVRVTGSGLNTRGVTSVTGICAQLPARSISARAASVAENRLNPGMCSVPGPVTLRG